MHTANQSESLTYTRNFEINYALHEVNNGKTHLLLDISENKLVRGKKKYTKQITVYLLYYSFDFPPYRHLLPLTMINLFRHHE